MNQREAKRRACGVLALDAQHWANRAINSGSGGTFRGSTLPASDRVRFVEAFIELAEELKARSVGGRRARPDVVDPDQMELPL